MIGIVEKCFIESTGLVGAALPESVRFIGDYVFAMSSLEEVAFDGDEYHYIGSGAFMGSSLRQAELPRYVDTLGEGVFDGCDNLVLGVAGGSYAEEYAQAHSISYVTAEE